MEQGRVWMRYEGETRRFALKENKLDVGKIAKFWKLDLETVSNGPDPVEFNEQGLSTLSIHELQDLMQDDLEECGDGASKATPFIIQAKQLQSTPAPGVTLEPAPEHQFSYRFNPSPAIGGATSTDSFAWQLKSGNDNLMETMQNGVLEITRAMDFTSKALEEVTEKKIASILSSKKGSVILDNLKNSN